MNKTISMQEMGTIIKEQLAEGGQVRFTPKGNSMLPMLRNNLDTVTLKRSEGRLKKYDLPLYQRKDNSYVLHRVVKVCNDGTYMMRGDNQLYTERGITDEQIVGVVASFTRKDKEYTDSSISYRLYSFAWVNTNSVRRLLKRTRRFLGRVKRKIKRIINH
ncbi:MAG: S24/S26 family peptidase [Lachnospiraceae bacterium]|nr:S24/S26 family peptidase [Lachnospiraceae bacterium]